MFNHKIIFRFFSLVFIAWIFFGLSEAACTPWVGVRAWYGVAWYGSMPTTCQFGTPWTPSRFNNTKSYLEWNNNFKYLVNVYWLTINDNCYSNDTLVFQIQTKLVNISPSCITCIDWKFWGHTQFIVNNTSCRPTCAPGNQPNTDWLCNPWYAPDTVNWCCLPPDCSEGEKLQQNSVWWCDDPWFVSDWAWCCIPDCQDPKKPANTPDCSDLDWYKYENWCCVVSNSDHQPTVSVTPDSFQDLNTTINITVNFWDWVNLDSLDCTKITVTNVDTPSRIQSTSCTTTVKPKEFKDVIITSPAWTTKYTDDQNSLLATKSVTSWITWCNYPQIITWWKCQCPDASPLNNWACCTTAADWKVSCTCWGAKIWSWNACVCPSGKILKWDKCVCDSSQWCCGIQLNTVVPFIWDCIEMDDGESSNNTTRVNALNAFPILMWSLSKMLVTAILIFSFVMVVIWWVLITAWWIDPANAKKWREIIWKVIVWLALLWASWIILRLINPNFFW